MTIVAGCQECPQGSIPHPQGAKHQLLLLRGFIPLRRRPFGDTRPPKVLQEHPMHLRQGVVSRNQKHCVAYRVGDLHVGFLFAMMEMICETLVQSLDAGEIFVGHVSTSELSRKAFERANDQDDLVAVDVPHWSISRPGVLEGSDVQLSRDQVERLANGRARKTETNTQSVNVDLPSRTEFAA